MNPHPVSGIRSISIQRQADGSLGKVRVVFGPHHFVEVHAGAEGQVEFWLGATHHGIRANASVLGGELEGMIEEARAQFPANRLDHVPFWSGPEETVG